PVHCGSAGAKSQGWLARVWSPAPARQALDSASWADSSVGYAATSGVILAGFGSQSKRSGGKKAGLVMFAPNTFRIERWRHANHLKKKGPGSGTLFDSPTWTSG